MSHKRKDISNQFTKVIPFQPSTIETVDFAMYDWLNEAMNLFVTTNKGWQKIDVVWTSAERAFQVKQKRERRDINGTVNYPLIMVERKSIDKDLARKGTAFGNVMPVNDAKGGAASITVARLLNQDKTSNFANAQSKKRTGHLNFPRRNKKIVYETISIPMPVYINVTYSILLRTQYQQQMNELVQPFITKPGGINYQIMKREGHRFEAFVEQEFAQEGNSADLSLEERKYETRITIKVLAYLIGKDKNDEQPKLIYRQNAVDVKFPRERIVFSDKLEHTDSQSLIGIEDLSIGDVESNLGSEEESDIWGLALWGIARWR